MQAVARNYFGLRTVITKDGSGNQTSFSEALPSGGTYDFSFTGFGSNDKRRKKLPTAGTYFKSDYHNPLGSMKVISRFPAGDANPIVGWTETEGVLTHAFADDFVGHPAFTSQPVSAACYNRAISDLYEQIRNSEVNLAVTLGEAPETAAMLRALGKLIYDAYTVVKKARAGKAVGNGNKSVKALYDLHHNPSLVAAQLWLGYKYGWAPAYNDIWNYCNFTRRMFDKMEFKGKSRIMLDNPFTSTTLNGSVRGQLRIRHQVRRLEKCQIGVTASVANQDAYNLTRLTSLNPALVAWELTPLSFVFDWFIDVGGFLENLEASIGHGLNFHSGYVTKLYYVTGQQTYDDTRTVDTAGFPANRISYDIRWRASRTVASKSRTVLGGFPRPEFPTLDIRLGWQRILSTAALVRTILLKGVQDTLDDWEARNRRPRRRHGS